MKKKIVPALLILLFFWGAAAGAKDYPDFSIHKLESGQAGNTLLVVGGIQGDEPGGFNAAALLVTHYNIRRGNVWVVPNLNFISIIQRSRGVYGDLNRKFAALQSTDPEYNTIKKIKRIILDDQVDVVLNLHDGSGFYRPRYVSRMHNPQRWGQCVIIDQERIKAEYFGNLGDMARQVVSEVNLHLFSGEHVYSVKNTRTSLGDAEMAKTLTYFAVCNDKSAFGIEVSKSLPTHKRTFYHLRMLESYMSLLGIEYERNFPLTVNGVRDAINKDVKLAFYDNKILLDVANARDRLGYIPFKKGSDIIFSPSNPLLTLVNSGTSFKVYHGNRRLTRLYPEYFEYDLSIDSITMQIDGNEKKVGFGKMLEVDSRFKVVPEKGYRVNVIGFKKAGVVNEAGILIGRNDIQQRFSVDKSGRIFRVEVYRGNKFSGMLLVNFIDKAKILRASKPLQVSLLQQSPAANIKLD